MNVFQYPTYVHAREPRIKCNEDSNWRIIKHHVDEAKKEQDISDLSVLGIDEFSVEKHHVYVTLFYDIRNSRVIHIWEGKDSDVFVKFIMKHPFLVPSGIEYIIMDMYLSYISSAKHFFIDFSIVLNHFHVIKMMNDTLDRIRRKEARVNEILKHTRYDWLKNSSDLSGKGSPHIREIPRPADIACIPFQDCTPEIMAGECVHCGIISEEMNIMGIQVADARYREA